MSQRRPASPARHALRARWPSARWLSCVLLGGALLGGAALGCGADKREAEQLLTDIARMRDTPRHQRLPLLEALEKRTLQGEAAEGVRKSCTHAYRALHEAHTRLDDTRAKLKQVRAKGDSDTALLGELLQATRLLQEAQTAHLSCRKAVTQLRASLR